MAIFFQMMGILFVVILGAIFLVVLFVLWTDWCFVNRNKKIAKLKAANKKLNDNLRNLGKKYRELKKRG